MGRDPLPYIVDEVLDEVLNLYERDLLRYAEDYNCLRQAASRGIVYVGENGPNRPKYLSRLLWVNPTNVESFLRDFTTIAFTKIRQ
jgi:hypothetical protein